MTYKVIQVGAGGFGKQWCTSFLPANVKDGLIEVVAAVDLNPDALQNAKSGLGLRDDQCYADIKKAFAETKADFCTIVVPPAFHEQVVDLALQHDMHILSEKPIADTLEGSIRIVEKVRSAGKKMGVTMSHRFAQDKTTLRHELQSGRHGRLDYLMCRFTVDCRRFGSWGKFRHEIPDTLMVEGAVHHLDILADLTGYVCDTIYAQTWNPPWGEFAGDSQGLVHMTMTNGTKAVYEGAKSNAVTLNGWSNEYIRAECEHSTLIMSHKEIEKYAYGGGGQAEQIPLLQQNKWGHAWLIEQFVEWLDGGPPMATNVEDNLQSVALIFAAIESSRTGSPVKVQEMLERARSAVSTNWTPGR
ncbi:Gfo/Idh/MocA family protein [Paenibacillus roseipurpureus]|uniref:Gfo/Idh/MocA family oxidoreductase n=1 Tax=Paenibacillus roseopurpureus TaxID=2918901 RepID=A0AA96LKV4_9BACL|nr:Gfo/Idh/MocA family oxidoreductase [Paenibacillus sp. MBLB1832]WNR42946.1 Gfo/Idh/MocA family oxidoreductase [Paenibacillus sp. MBLB1832]